MKHFSKLRNRFLNPFTAKIYHNFESVLKIRHIWYANKLLGVWNFNVVLKTAVRPQAFCDQLFIGCIASNGKISGKKVLHIPCLKGYVRIHMAFIGVPVTYNVTSQAITE